MKDSVNEATEVLSATLNTQKCLLESGMEILGEAGIPPRLTKNGYLPESALCVSVSYPWKADKGGEEGCPFSSRGSASQKREGWHSAILRCGHQRPDHTKGWGMAAGAKEKKRKKFPCLPRRILKQRGSCQGALRPPGRATLSGCQRRTESATPRSWKLWRWR